ncbi:MAG: SCP2 sterol-binding domain-containing protein [Alphaproteobacteria bacterium]
MTNAEIIEKMNAGLDKVGGLKNTVMLDFGDEGKIFVDKTVALEQHGEADCTITVSKENLMAIAKRELDPIGAFMSNRLRISGNKSVALGLVSLFSSMT